MPKKNIFNVERIANCSMAKATAELSKAYPKANVLSITQSGNRFVAKLAFDEEPLMDDPAPAVDDLEVGMEDDLGMGDAMEGEGDDGLEGMLAEVSEKLDKVMDALGVTEGDDEGDDLDADLGDAGDLGEDPLPSPVEEDQTNVFASKIAGRRHFTATCRAEESTSDFQIVKDAAKMFPDHDVVQIERDGENVKLLMRHVQR